jgi:hypothetical protein
LYNEKKRLEDELESLEARPDLDNIPINVPLEVGWMTRRDLRNANMVERRKKQITLIEARIKKLSLDKP